MEKWIFKILRPKEWQAAKKNPSFKGAVVDIADGFIHFSTHHQIQETANKHFANEDSVTILAFAINVLPGTHLKWETSRGGALFPHLYASLDARKSTHKWDVIKGADNCFDLDFIIQWATRHA